MTSEGKRRIARFNLNLIYLSAFYFILIWSIFTPIQHIIETFSFEVLINGIVEIIWKTLVVFLSVFILMIVNCYFFTNAFEK